VLWANAVAPAPKAATEPKIRAFFAKVIEKPGMGRFLVSNLPAPRSL
jgi:hypothetical protein